MTGFGDARSARGSDEGERPATKSGKGSGREEASLTQPGTPEAQHFLGAKPRWNPDTGPAESRPLLLGSEFGLGTRNLRSPQREAGSQSGTKAR